MHKFKVGDKVRFIKNHPDNCCKIQLGNLGTVSTLRGGLWDVLVLWDKVNSFCSCPKDCIELVEDTPKPKFKVGDKIRIEDKPERWSSLLANNYPLDLIYPEEFIIEGIKDGGYYTAMVASGYGFDLSHLITENNIKLVEEECKSCEVDKPWKVLTQGFIGELGGYDYYKDNEPTTSSIKKGGSIMTKITTYIKNLTLSTDEKLLRKYNLHDECGENTEEGREAILNNFFNTKENQAYLVSIAQGLEDESKIK